MTRPDLPAGSTVSITLTGIPAEVYLGLLADAGRAGRALHAEVVDRLRRPVARVDPGAPDGGPTPPIPPAAPGARRPPISRPLGAGRS